MNTISQTGRTLAGVTDTSARGQALRPGREAGEVVLRRPSWPRRVLCAVARQGGPPFMLTYHGVSDVRRGDDPHGLMTSSERFARHVEWLSAAGYELGRVDHVWTELQRAPGRQGLGAISFDDGLAKTLFGTLPTLERHGAHATAFITTGYLGRRHPDLGGDERIVTASQVVELAHAGMEIGAHSVSHPDLTTLPYLAVLDEMRRSKATLEDLIAAPVTSFAYPHGRFSPSVAAAAREAGFGCACASSGGAHWRAYALPREGMLPSTGVARLALKVWGLDGPVLAVAHARTRVRQALAASG